MKGKKVFVSQVFHVIYGIGMCYLPLVAYFVRDWRSIQLWIATPGVLFAILLGFTFESPPWLILTKKFSEVNKIAKRLLTKQQYQENSEARRLQKISTRQSNDENPAILMEFDKFDEAEGGEELIREGNTNKHTIIDVLKLPNMRKKTLILFYAWLATSAVYYGLTLNSADIGGNVFLNFLLSAFVEVPAQLLGLPMMNRWGRRPSLTSTFCLSGILCICMMFVPKELVWLNVTLSTLGKFTICISFGVIYVFTSDIYPTSVRNVGLGICSSWARIGGMIAPFVAMLDVIGFAVPYVAFGLMAVLAGILGIFLPETLGKVLPETLREAEMFGKRHKDFMASICGDKHVGIARCQQTSHITGSIHDDK